MQVPTEGILPSVYVCTSSQAKPSASALGILLLTVAGRVCAAHAAMKRKLIGEWTGKDLFRRTVGTLTY